MSEIYDDFLQVSQEFLNVIVAETNYLMSHDIEKALELLPEKKRLSQVHQEYLATFTGGEGWGKISMDQLHGLKIILDNLAKALIQNQQALKLVHGVQEGLVTRIKDVVCQHQAPVCHYSKDKRQTINHSPVSLSVINRSL